MMYLQKTNTDVTGNAQFRMSGNVSTTGGTRVNLL